MNPAFLIPLNMEADALVDSFISAFADSVGLRVKTAGSLVIVSTISHYTSFCLYLLSMLCHMHKHLLLFTHMYSTQSLN